MRFNFILINGAYGQKNTGLMPSIKTNIQY